MGKLGPSGAGSTMPAAAVRWESGPQVADKYLDCRYLGFCGGGNLIGATR